MRLFHSLVLALAALALPALPALAADARSELVTKCCGDAAAMGEAGRSLIPLAAEGTSGDRLWARAITTALIDRKFICDADGAVVQTPDGGTVDAATQGKGGG